MENQNIVNEQPIVTSSPAQDTYNIKPSTLVKKKFSIFIIILLTITGFVVWFKYLDFRRSTNADQFQSSKNSSTDPIKTKQTLSLAVFLNFIKKGETSSAEKLIAPQSEFPNMSFSQEEFTYTIQSVDNEGEDISVITVQIKVDDDVTFHKFTLAKIDGVWLIKNYSPENTQ